MSEEIVERVCMQWMCSGGLLGWAVPETRLAEWLETTGTCVATDLEHVPRWP